MTLGVLDYCHTWWP